MCVSTPPHPARANGARTDACAGTIAHPLTSAGRSVETRIMLVEVRIWKCVSELGMVTTPGSDRHPRQKRVVSDFYLQHACMAEFALNIEGFPPDATDETQIRTFLRDAFGNTDVEVSVCYDIRTRCVVAPGLASLAPVMRLHLIGRQTWRSLAGQR